MRQGLSAAKIVAAVAFAGSSILAHEVYRHAVPYLLAGHLSGKCADPSPGQRASESCAIRRENEVRVQMGFGRRTEYGLNGLSMVRRLQ